MTRGREANVAHVDSEVEAGQDSQPTVPRTRSPCWPGILGRDEQRGGAVRRSKPETWRSSNPRAWRPCSRSGRTWKANTSRPAGGTAHPERDAGFAARVTASPAWPTLAARLPDIEAAGGDPEAALRAAVEVRPSRPMPWTWPPCCTIDSDPKPSPGEAGPGLHVPVLPPTSGDSPYPPAMRQVAERMDQRIIELGERAAQNPPEWAARSGPSPPTPWAGPNGPTGPPSSPPTGKPSRSKEPTRSAQAPPPARPRLAAGGTAAQAALTGDQPRPAWASDEELAERVAAGDRAEMDRPALVDLAGAAQSERDLQAELVYATEDQWRARTDPTITPEDSGRRPATSPHHPRGPPGSQRTPAGRRSRLPGLPTMGDPHRDHQGGRPSGPPRTGPAKPTSQRRVQPGPAAHQLGGLPVGASRPISGHQGAGAGLGPARPSDGSPTASIATPKPGKPARPTDCATHSTQPGRRGPTGTRSQAATEEPPSTTRTRRPPRRPTSQNRRLRRAQPMESVAGPTDQPHRPPAPGPRLRPPRPTH